MNSSAASPGGPPRGPQFDNRRIAAGLIDVVLVAVVAAVIMFAAGVLGGGGTEMTGPLRLVVLAWALFYYFAMESGAGQTVGKRAMGLRVLTVDGKRAGYGEVGVRTALRVIDGIGIYLVGLIVMLVTGERRQRLGDLAAKTCVTSADWQPSAGVVPAAAGAAAVASSSAIVLPTAPVEPAGTAFEAPESPVPAPAVEMPAAPSPFTTFEETAAVVEAPVVEEPPVVEEAAPPAFPVMETPVVAEPAVEPAGPPAWTQPPAPDLDQVVDGPADGTWEPLPAPSANGSGPSPEPEPEPTSEPEATDDSEPEERVHVRTVETLSAMDLLMSEVEADEHAGRRSTG